MARRMTHQTHIFQYVHRSMFIQMYSIWHGSKAILLLLLFLLFLLSERTQERRKHALTHNTFEIMQFFDQFIDFFFTAIRFTTFGVLCSAVFTLERPLMGSRTIQKKHKMK